MKSITIQKLIRSVLFAGLACLGGSAAAATITWAGPSDFDSEQMLFAAFSANGLNINSLDVYGFGGYAHTHAASMSFSIKLLLDGTWTSVYSQALDGSNPEQYLALIPAPITFSQGLVSGLWFDSSPSQSQTYHGFAGCLNLSCDAYGPSMQFEFADTPRAVPEPGSAALVGLGLLGFAATRRRRKL